jgi:hypothetical protein
VEKHDVEREIRGMFADVGSEYLTCALEGAPPNDVLWGLFDELENAIVPSGTNFNRAYDVDLDRMFA